MEEISKKTTPRTGRRLSFQRELHSARGVPRVTADRRELSRRGFLRLSAAGAAVTALGLPLLSACTPAAPSQPAGGAAKPAATGAAPSSALPGFVPFTSGPKPDFKSASAQVTDAYEHLPKDIFKSWNKAAPGAGSTVNVFINGYYPLPTPFDQNPTWQEVNKQLNANMQMNIVPAGGDGRLRLQTMMAGDDLTDIIHLFGGMMAAPNLPDFIKAKCADLTPYLAGDAIKDYPNLAAIPTYAWQKSNSVVDGKLYMWPIHRYLPGLSYFFKNSNIYDKVIGANYVPKDAEDLKKVMQQLNRPQENVWAVGNIATAPFMFGLAGYASMFGAPNWWGKDASGKLVRDRETEEYKAAVGFVRDVLAAGLMWPDALTAGVSRGDFAAGRFALSVEGFGNSWNDFWRRGLQQNPPQHFDLIPPFPGTAGGKVVSYNSGGFISTNVMKKASPDRIKELLRIVDFLAAPFGSQEAMLLSYGIQGPDYTLDANGDPVLTTEGVNRAG
jgi:putative aldouronate transport system substrate-binding protein